jgi:hypothetical protein
MVSPRWALSADKRLFLGRTSVDPNRFAAADLGPREQGSHHGPRCGAFGPARRRSPVVGAWFSSRLQPSVPLTPTSPICRLLNADGRPFRGASQGFEGSSQPPTPRRTTSSRSRPGCEPFSGGFRSIMDALLPSRSVVIAFDAPAGSGGGLGRSRPIRRRISANRARGTATSASLKTT